MSFGEYLKMARSRASLTQAAAAKALGFHPQYVSNMERYGSLPTKHFAKLASIYGIDVNEMVEHYLQEKKRRVHQELGLG